MKRLSFLLICMICCITTMADEWTDPETGYTWSYTVSDNGATIGENKWATGDLVIPATINGYPVTSIGDDAFYKSSGLTSVTIPNSVTSIGTGAFSLCSVTSVTIPNSVTSIGAGAFEACSGLTSINIPNSVTSIGYGAFFGCSGLTSVTIPYSVTSIGYWPFSDCSSLTTILVESGNTVYDSRNNCNAIIETQTNTLIQGCKSTIIPNSVSAIGSYAFDGCKGLTSITIPNSVTSIGYGAFCRCSSNLTSLKVESGNTKYDSRNNCNAIIETETNTLILGCKNTVIPNSVTSIGDYAFDGCKGLTSVTIPNSVTSIGFEAFYGCSGLTSITIPNSVTSIGYEAFYGCSGLTSVVTKMDNPCSINSGCFPNNVFNNTTLYVPQGTIDKYLATESWNKFLHIEELNSSKLCATPTISYKNGKLSYNCETEGAICHTTITNEDIKSFDGNEIDLTVTYNVSVYATKDGYFDSDMANATLCWIEVNPQNEGIATDVNQIASVAVLIKATGGQLTIEGAEDNTTVAAYTLDGVQLGSAISRNGVATINTNVSAGTVTIVKIGSKSVKIVMQ